MLHSIQTGEDMVPVLYCDIDGTIRLGKDELGRFVNTAEDVQVFPEVPSLLRVYKDLDWRIVGISNQGGIALGHQTFDQCVAAMMETNKQCGYVFDKMAWCMHHPDARNLEMAVCWCRKPKAGLVVEAALSLAEKTGEIYPPHLGLFIGDRPEDAQCATNAGLPFMNAAEWRTGAHVGEIAR